ENSVPDGHCRWWRLWSFRPPLDRRRRRPGHGDLQRSWSSWRRRWPRFWRCLRRLQIVELFLEATNLCLVLLLDVLDFLLQLFDLIVNQRRRLCEHRAWRTTICKYCEQRADCSHTPAILLLVHCSPSEMAIRWRDRNL